jgi:hypothetical protein
VLAGEEWEMPESDADLLRPPAEDRSHISSRSHISGKEGEGENTGEVEETTALVGPKYPIFSIDDFEKLNINLANDMYVDTPKNKRKYMIHLQMLSEDGQVLYTTNSFETGRVAGVKCNAACRDIRLNRSDDERIGIDLRKLEAEVHHILVYLETRLPNAGPMPYNRFYISDAATSQVLDTSFVDEQGFGEEASPLLLLYRIFRQEYDPRGMKA